MIDLILDIENNYSIGFVELKIFNVVIIYVDINVNVVCIG